MQQGICFPVTYALTLSAYLLRCCQGMLSADLCQCCRYRVVYRLVNTVYVMAVASAAANVFSLMRLVDAMTRVATLASRGVEVTPEKLSRRYPEVSPSRLISFEKCSNNA